MIRALLLSVLALLTTPAPAQELEDFASGCADDSGGDRCSDAAVKAWHDRYGLRPAETMAAEGTAVRRMLYVDGYGRDVLAISAIRAKGVPPVIEIRQPRGKDGAQPTTWTRPIPEKAWDRILGDAAIAHRRLVPETKPGDEVNVCLHAWVSRFESADPRQLAQFVVGQMWLDPESRAMTASACEGGPTDRFGATLAEVAAETFGECSSIDADRMRHGIALIEACMGLRGDTIAAGHVMSIYRDLYPLIFRAEEEGKSWPDLLRADFNLASQGLKEGEQADWDSLRALFAKADNVYFDVEQATGLDADRVEMLATFGWADRSTGTGAKKPERHTRKLRLMWVRQTGDWVVDQIRLAD
ncbi:hypothetical protein BWQ93_19920 [Sphingopyxis sp. QXT-31]|uniref:hypothetical protein n=1 Tax=Sphingopyxis sp. QXT-31 TaxID=1357916 RepID=UPI00097937E3|nr:hypothetical protein [Sphingopyxis sp. QXT-31]AQA00472.1 hypothetical protein BWQ93_19920 [Sphingopyxis sp. QXT-31]